MFAVGIALAKRNGCLAPQHPSGLSFFDNNVYRYGASDMDPLSANLLTIAVPVVAVVGAASLFMVRRKRAGASGGLNRAESWIASLIGAGAMMNALLCALALWGNASWMFTVEPFRVDGLHYSGVTTPESLEGVDHVAAAGYQSVWIDVMGLPDGTRWLFYIEEGLPLAASLTISIVVAWLSFTVVRERPFARAFPIAIGVASIAVMIGGLGSQFAGALARSSVIEYLGADRLVKDNSTAPATESFATFWVSLDLSPVGWAFGLLLVAAAFQIGVRMQKDTDALV